ncbi:hypothetical protein SAMN05216207_1018135 [Pseudonocardia ammonioxydans]|uniref:Uncharacterized protein n=1 Tax=Pseudonocardia ammonioxydans TaxID=260086 RepID=A0A1I5AU10_PSUAM|nr:hypothetical protein SAMN05216207_1018135 [Pseudonocardia ammonioxydans]
MATVAGERTAGLPGRGSSRGTAPGPRHDRCRSGDLVALAGLSEFSP